MKIAIITAIAFSLSSIGCAGDAFDSSEEAQSYKYGSGGSNESSGSGGANGEQNGEQNGEGSTAGIGGGAGGTGEVIDTGSGGDRTGGGSTCIPKTCDEITFEITGEFGTADGEAGAACGAFDNGCGGTLTCGCNEDGACGAAQPQHVTCWGNGICDQETTISVENVCGGGCLLQPGYSATMGSPDYDYYTCPTIHSEAEAAEYLGLETCIDNINGIGYYCK